MEAVFLKLLNMSIAAGWAVLAVIVLRALLKKAPKAMRVALWALVGLRLALPFSFESALSLIPSAETVSPDILYAKQSAIHSGIPALNQAVNPGLAQSLAPAPAASVNPAQIAVFIASVIWAAGVVFMLAHAAASYIRLRYRVREAVPLGAGLWQSGAVASPFVLGLIRPRIYLPAQMEGGALAHVVAHERAHIRRRDHWIKPAGFLLLAIYWFHPLVWLAYLLLCRDIELACDERVVREMGAGEKKAYSEALLAVSAPRRAFAAAACPLAFGEVGVKQRIKNVLHYKKPAFWVVMAALVACAAATVCLLTNPKGGGQDLSFLHYENAVSLAAQQDSVRAVDYPPVEPGAPGSIRLGEADGAALARYLEGVNWQRSYAPKRDFASTGSVEFIIHENYCITVYEYPLRALVSFGGQQRLYRTREGDYEAAAALVRTSGAMSAYFPTECVYRNPLSSLFAPDDNGLGYFIGTDSVAIINRQSGETLASFKNIAWNWQPFTQTDWAAMFGPLSPLPGDAFWARDIMRHALSAKYHLLYAQGAYWIIEAGDGGAAGPIAWNIFALAPGEGGALTLEDVLALCARGNALIWGDLAGYRFEDVGSGRSIYSFFIDENWRLIVNSGRVPGVGEAIGAPVELVYLPDGTSVDIRTENAAAFIAAKKSLCLRCPVVYSGTSLAAMVPAGEGKQFPAITYDPAHNEKWTVPFSVYVNGAEMNGGWYEIADAKTGETLEFVHPSGLASQTYLLQNAKAGRSYRVTVRFSDAQAHAAEYAFDIHVN